MPRAAPPAGASGTMRALHVTAVAVNSSSAKVYFRAIAGAKDYRIFDTAHPRIVKYAGLVHGARGAHGIDSPATSIEWNLLSGGKPHTLVVEAVDELGPISPGSLYTAQNSPLYNVPVSTRMPSTSGSGMMPMLGSDEGETLDGKISINGQGPNTDWPRVVARSKPFDVRATKKASIPSTLQATQTYFDPFNSGEAGTLRTKSIDVLQDSASYTLNDGTARAATIQYVGADVKNSFPFIMDGHFMDILFDGGTPGSHHPLHVRYATMAYSPDKTPDPTGATLHVTMEVDAHVSDRRWMDFALAPAADPLQRFQTTLRDGIDNADEGLFLAIKPTGCELGIFAGPRSASDRRPVGTAGGRHGAELWGSAGQSSVNCRRPVDGIAFDNRSRFDFFVSQTHAALFENGKLVVQSSVPAGSFQWFNYPLRVYFAHYVYHTRDDIEDLLRKECYPMNAMWFNDPLSGTPRGEDACGLAYPGGYGFQYSDERHWDNFGFEVLPRSVVPPGGNFSELGRLIHMPARRNPQFKQ